MRTDRADMQICLRLADWWGSCPGTALGLLGGLQVFARRSLEVADIVGGHSLSCLPASTLSPPGLSRCRLTGSVSPRLVTMHRFLSQGEVLGKSQDELINREFAPTVSKECVSKTLQFFFFCFVF